MKKSFKFLLSFLLLNILVFGAFADGYHVCVASYKNLKNAETMVTRLENQSVAAFVYRTKVNSEDYYRVLLSKEFKKIEDARKYRDEVQKYSFVKELGLKGFWVCHAEKQAAAPKVKTVTPAPKPAPKVAPAPVPVPAPKAEPVPVKKAEVKTTPQAPVREVEPIPEEPEVKSVEEIPAKAPVEKAEVEPLIVKEAKEEKNPPKTEEVVNPKVEEENVLEKNTKESEILSEQRPYSVAVRSYKYKEFAENDKNRLTELGFNSYLVNTFDNKTFFSFNLHAGAFATREEAEALQNQLADKGVFDTEISDYNTIWTRIEKYDTVIATEKITFDDGLYEYPKNISPAVDLILKNFPVNKDFQIDGFLVLDHDKYMECLEKPNNFDSVHGYVGSDESLMHAAALANYYDVLMGQGVSVFLATADEYTFGTVNSEPIKKIDLKSEHGVFACSIYDEAGELVLHGVNDSEKLFLTIKTKDFSQEKFEVFLNDLFKGESLRAYPQLRKTLFVLPDANENISRDFVGFNFTKIGDSYAISRNNADWAVPIVGHYLSRAVLLEKNALVNVGFYDLDYDFNAKSVHKTFTESKNGSEVTESNHPISIQGADGWYLVNENQREISFSTKSYVISIDSNSETSLDKDDLIGIATDLKIWN